MLHGTCMPRPLALLRLSVDVLIAIQRQFPINACARRLDVAHTMAMRFLVKTVHCTTTRVVVGDQRDSILHLSVDPMARTLRIAKAYARGHHPGAVWCEDLTLRIKCTLFLTPGTPSCALLRRSCRGSAKAAQ